MTQVERLARELAAAHFAACPRNYRTLPWEHPHFMRKPWLSLARHVLRRERAARGRTIGYCWSDTPLTFDRLKVADFSGSVTKNLQHVGDDEFVYRVVAVPKPKKASKR